MSEENLKIADIVFAYIEGTIMEKQLDELIGWLEESDEHRQMFQQLTTVAAYREKEAIYRRFDPYYDFDRLKREVRVRKQFGWKRVAAVAAVMMLPLVAIFLLLEQRTEPPRQESSREISLQPGKSMATLVLSDGSTRLLDQEHFAIMEGNKRIENISGELTYRREDSIPQSRDAYNTMRVPRGAEYKVILEDGTRIWLNSGSNIRYPVVFTGKERKIWVSGEVFMEVAKDSTRPFIVNVENVDIKVLGTEFNVRAYREEECIMTTLVEGRVQVGDSSGRVTVLSPSEQLVYNKMTGNSEVREVDVELFVSWKDGVYLFESQRLEDIMTRISKWYDVDVFYRNAGAKDIIFSGRLKRYGDAKMLLNVFEGLGGVRFTVQGKTVVVETE